MAPLIIKTDFESAFGSPIKREIEEVLRCCDNDKTLSWIYHMIGEQLNWNVWHSLTKEQKKNYLNDQTELRG